MENISNKDLMTKLQEFYLTQPPEIIALVAASLMIDINRFYHIEHLPEKQLECLFIRTKKNVEELEDFIKNGPSKGIEIMKMNSDEI